MPTVRIKVRRIEGLYSQDKNNVLNNLSDREKGIEIKAWKYHDLANITGLPD
jgi:hypothetical protein